MVTEDWDSTREKYWDFIADANTCSFNPIRLRNLEFKNYTPGNLKRELSW